MPDKRPRYTSGTYLLDEIDGDLYYRGICIGPIPPSDRIAWWARREGRQVWLAGLFPAIRSAIGIANPLIYAVYRCKVCSRWAAGSGRTVCSPECRRESKAQWYRAKRRQLSDKD